MCVCVFSYLIPFRNLIPKRFNPLSVHLIFWRTRNLFLSLLPHSRAALWYAHGYKVESAFKLYKFCTARAQEAKMSLAHILKVSWCRRTLTTPAKSFVVRRNRFDHATLVECLCNVSRNRLSWPLVIEDAKIKNAKLVSKTSERMWKYYRKFFSLYYMIFYIVNYNNSRNYFIIFIAECIFKRKQIWLNWRFVSSVLNIHLSPIPSLQLLYSI